MTDQELRALLADLDAADVSPDMLVETREEWACVERFNAVHDHFAAEARKAVPRLLDENKVLREMLAESRREHDTYCRRDASVTLNVGGRRLSMVAGGCDCGAASWNTRIDTALAGKEGA